MCKVYRRHARDPLRMFLICRVSYWDSSAGVLGKHCGKLDFVKNLLRIRFTRQSVLSEKQGLRHTARAHVVSQIEVQAVRTGFSSQVSGSQT